MKVRRWRFSLEGFLFACIKVSSACFGSFSYESHVLAVRFRFFGSYKVLSYHEGLEHYPSSSTLFKFNMYWSALQLQSLSIVHFKKQPVYMCSGTLHARWRPLKNDTDRIWRGNSQFQHPLSKCFAPIELISLKEVFLIVSLQVVHLNICTGL